MSENLGLHACNLMVATFVFMGMNGGRPCYAMWGEDYILNRLNGVTYWSCTRNHFGYSPQSLQYCARCYQEDQRIQKDIQDRIKKPIPKNTEESDEPTS